jgi:hypothetical protein
MNRKDTSLFLHCVFYSLPNIASKTHVDIGSRSCACILGSFGSRLYTTGKAWCWAWAKAQLPLILKLSDQTRQKGPYNLEVCARFWGSWSTSHRHIHYKRYRIASLSLLSKPTCSLVLDTTLPSCYSPRMTSGSSKDIFRIPMESRLS